MHELAIGQALMSQIDTIASARSASHVVSIVTGMGPLSGVETQMLQHAYSVANVGTVAEGAELLE